MLKKSLAALLALLAATAFAAVDVNRATVADLDSIKGIGPGTSSKIVEQRTAAPFRDWADFITRVPGVGERRAARLSAEGLRVNGAAFGGAATAAASPAASPAAAAAR
ncbi:helix-hairpin-helix domain-containing protein [Hydrogenophaga sp.]|uniref:ComEA family DNA-binding protein n=1 Tax=Hydrogenophaga sp. TaxID=1904254 RepID=UPI0019CA4867|nr:helix-hairpin-helix domain-containing protein [Hydrogenophaga sp.]MBD3892871.1 helix-hairpin-helix domain-containing protein [Hydrogenophaga sp.]